MSRNAQGRRAGFARIAVAGVALSGAMLALGAGATQAAAKDDGSRRNCFFVTQWNNSKAISATEIYLRVNLNDIYKLTLGGSGSQQLLDPTYHLVSTTRGGSTICSAIDLDLKVSSGRGFAVPVIAKSLVKLTPEEVAAIPKKDRP